jgi:1,4-alpha-glucan branching enzyme
MNAPSPDLLPAPERERLALGSHARPWQWLGAHAIQHEGVAGVRFAVWAPAASRVSVVGSFNDWDGRRHPLRLHEGLGLWEGFVPGAQVGDLYKFELADAQGQVLPLKADPYARQAQLRPDNASVVADPLPPTQPLSAERAQANGPQAPLSVYELHPMSWRREGQDFPDWDQLARELPPYVAGLGFTHVELLPVAEHPLDESWGYQSLGLYAPTARLGDPAGLKRLVQACHAQGLGVLLDWVPAHFPADDHGLGRFDGSPLFEYADPREGWHHDWQTLIYDFAKPQVRQFLMGSALYWLECYGVDGLRVDAVASMLYRDYSRPAGEWLPNAQGGRENLEAISLLRELNDRVRREVPGAIMVAEESSAFPLVSAPTEAGGLGFHYKWNMGWMNDTLAYQREQPIHRRWHHERMSFGLVYAWSEHFMLPLSHDEVVHGKGSLLGKMPTDPALDEAQNALQRLANLRAYYGFMWGHPGKKLLFMGQEFAQPGEWDCRSQLPWALQQQPAHAGMQRWVAALNALYREQPALHRLDKPGSDGVAGSGFEWLQAEDALHSVYAFVRQDGQGGTPVLVVCNFTPVARPGYGLPLPAHLPRAWSLRLSSAAPAFCGEPDLAAAQAPAAPSPWVGDGASLSLDLPPMSTLFLLPA